MKVTRLAALAGVAVIAIGTVGCNQGASGGGSYKIGIDMPQQGSELAGSEPVINGMKLALKQAGGKAGSYTIEVPKASILDDALNGVHDPQTGAQNAGIFIADPKVIGMLGPLNSNVAKAQIPLTNDAGLAQCSPANTNEGLTKPEFGALDVRKAKPTEINYVRVATTDDLQSKADADYLAGLGVKNLYIIDDTETFGKGIATNVDTYWTGHAQADRRRSRLRAEDDHRLRVDPDHRQGKEPGWHLLRRRDRHGWRPDPQGRRSGRPRRHPVHGPRRHQRRHR